MQTTLHLLLLALGILALSPAKLHAAGPAPLLARGNLVAWCIVPFDAQKRGPAERAEMIAQLDGKPAGAKPQVRVPLAPQK